MPSENIKSSVDSDFPDTPDQRLADSYHYQKLILAEQLLLPRVEKGDVLAIQSLLNLVATAISDGARVNKNIANYLSKAFVEIYNGTKADSAFGITRARGEKSTRLAKQKAFSIAFFIEETKEGNLEERFELAASRFFVSPDAARKAWQKNYKEARKIVNLNKEYFSM